MPSIVLERAKRKRERFHFQAFDELPLLSQRPLAPSLRSPCGDLKVPSFFSSAWRVLIVVPAVGDERDGIVVYRLMNMRSTRNAESFADLPPLRAGGFGIILSEGGADEGGDDAPAALAGMRQRVPEEVHVVASPGRIQHFGDGGLQALMRSETTSLTRRSPRRARERRNSIQNVSASEAPTVMRTLRGARRR